MRLKIISDGKDVPSVVNADTGEEIDGVRSITWSIDCRDMLAVTTIELLDVAACIETGQVVTKRITGSDKIS